MTGDGVTQILTVCAEAPSGYTTVCTIYQTEDRLGAFQLLNSHTFIIHALNECVNYAQIRNGWQGDYLYSFIYETEDIHLMTKLLMLSENSINISAVN